MYTFVLCLIIWFGISSNNSVVTYLVTLKVHINYNIKHLHKYQKG